MCIVYGCSSDHCIVKGAPAPYDILECRNKEIEIEFTDGTTIIVGNAIPRNGIWYIRIQNKGTAECSLEICTDRSVFLCSDFFAIDADYEKHRFIEDSCASPKTK